MSQIVKHGQRTARKGCKGCGTTNVYWGHDVDEDGPHCARCDVNGFWILLEADGVTPHKPNCPGNKLPKGPDGKPGDAKGGRNVPGEDAAKALTEALENLKGDTDTKEDNNVELTDVNPFEGIFGNDDKPGEEQPKPEEPKAEEPTDPKVKALSDLLDALSPSVDMEQIKKIVKEEVEGITHPTRTVVQDKDQREVKVIEGSHPKLADVIIDLQAGEHVMMVGPAGTGKSTIAEQAADALSMDYYTISLSPQTPTSQLLGYMQAEGKYVGTLFRQAYENGGVFHFDEIDNSHPAVLATINGALANGHMAFPDQMVPRHADFRCVASANTYGRGADRQYVGRQAMDAATQDRFTIETIEIDEALEDALCYNTGADAADVKKVLKFVRKLRANAIRHNINVVISPRASIGMCRLIAAGRKWEDAVAARARRGLSDSDWGKISRGA